MPKDTLEDPPPSTAAALASAFFPGPCAENGDWMALQAIRVINRWSSWREGLFPGDQLIAPGAGSLRARLERGLEDLCHAFASENPTHSPRYLAHMKSDVSLPALLGWLTALLHNPNNCAADSSPAGSAIEAEAIAMLAAMIGYDPARAQGHFTSGGTVANFEAVWRARFRLDHWLSMGLWLSEKTGERLDPFAAGHMGWPRFAELWEEHGPTDEALRACSAAAGNPLDVHRRIEAACGRPWRGPVLLAPGAAHYSWRKAANLFGLGEEAFWTIGLDHAGRLDLADLDRRITRAEAEGRPVLMAVAVAGGTGAGALDPVDRVCDRLERLQAERGWDIWRHVDAAWGGFLCSLLDGPDETEVLSPAAAAALRAIARAHSVTIDPHKQGYTPYACGAFLARDADCYAVSSFAAPYLKRPGAEAAKWTSTLEGSRPAGGAAAVWLTGRSLGFGPDGLGAVVAETIRTRRAFQAGVARELPMLRFVEPADGAIACFCAALPGEPLSRANQRTEALFQALLDSPELAVSMTMLGEADAAQRARHVASWNGIEDAEELVLIRCVLMNPYWASAGMRERLCPIFLRTIRRALRGILELERPQTAPL